MMVQHDAAYLNTVFRRGRSRNTRNFNEQEIVYLDI